MGSLQNLGLAAPLPGPWTCDEFGFTEHDRGLFRWYLGNDLPLADLAPRNAEGAPAMSSEAQILANRENAQKSTGPKSLEGKAQSRLNATTHGLSRAGAALKSYEPELVARRIAEWTAYRSPRTDRERWLVEQVALATVRVDYCNIEENAHRASTSQRCPTRPSWARHGCICRRARW